MLDHIFLVKVLILNVDFALENDASLNKYLPNMIHTFLWIFLINDLIKKKHFNYLI